MKKYKVLHILRGVYGGVPIVFYRLAKNFDKGQYEPIILFDTSQHSDIRSKITDLKIISLELETTHKGNNSKKRKKNSKNSFYLNDEKINKSIIRFYSFFKRLSQIGEKDIRKVAKLVKIIKKYDIDIIHTHSSIKYCKPELIAAKIYKIPFIIHCHGYPHMTRFDKIFNLIVNKYIYISTDVEKYHLSQGIPKNKGMIIHNGVEKNQSVKVEDTITVRQEFNIKANETLIGIIGRIDWWKGHEYFLRAFLEVDKKVLNVKGIIIGEVEKNVDTEKNMEYYKKLQKYIELNELENKIIFTGYRDDIQNIITALDIIVHASTTPEPFGLVVIEAMAAGKPVIATASGGILDIIENNVNGILIPAKDSKNMSRAIIKLILDKTKIKKMSEAAILHVNTNFTIENQIRKLQNLYETCVGN